MSELEEIKRKINTPGEFDQVIYIISHPRSGNTFLRYILEHITRFRSYGYIGSGNNDSVDNVGVLRGKPDKFWDESGLIRKRHGFYGELKKQTSPKKVVFIIRSPIDLQGRAYDIWERPSNRRESGKTRYIRLVQKYLNYAESPKMLLRYEDLMSDLPKAVNDVLKFLEFENDPVINQRKKEFFENVDHHIGNSRKRAPESYKAEALGYEKGLKKELVLERWRSLKEAWQPDHSGAFTFIENLYNTTH